MPELGSFALLLALVLSGYTLVAGAIALRQLSTNTGPGASLPSGSPRRHGVPALRAFFAVSVAAFALLWAAFNNDFSVAYILHHSNRALPGPYKFAALWSGQEGSLLLWAWLLATYGLVLRLRHKVDVRLTAFASTILAGIQLFFLLLLNFAATPFLAGRGEGPGRRFRFKPAPPISGDGDSPADAVPGLRGIQRPLRLCAGRADDALPRREVDPHHPTPPFRRW